MGIEIVHDHHSGFGIWEMNVHQITHTMGPINHGASVGDFDMPPGFQRGKEHEQVAGSVAFIFVVIFGNLPRLGWQWQARFFEWVILRALALPLLTNWVRFSRSSLVKVTLYRFAGIVLAFRHFFKAMPHLLFPDKLCLVDYWS